MMVKEQHLSYERLEMQVLGTGSEDLLKGISFALFPVQCPTCSIMQSVFHLLNEFLLEEK